MSEHVSVSKKVEVDPSMAFCGMPPSATELCIGALPAATLSTERNKISMVTGGRQQQCIF